MARAIPANTPPLYPETAIVVYSDSCPFNQIGEAQIATYPGEVLPKLGFQIKSAMDAKYRFIFGLADDELGYILDDQDFGREPYEYESSMSVGPTIGSLATNALLDLLDK